jgi:ribosomal protein S18 acetylase RimI-like enzyme
MSPLGSRQMTLASVDVINSTTSVSELDDVGERPEIGRGCYPDQDRMDAALVRTQDSPMPDSPMPTADTSGVRIRPAVARDLPRVSALAAELVRQHHRFDPQRFMLVEPIEEGYRWFLGRELRRKGAIVLVAEDDAGEGAVAGARTPAATILGYAYATLEPRNWNDLLDAAGKLNDLFVDPAGRRRGVGRALAGEVLARLRARGVPRVVLMTAWQNPQAQAFFEAIGFRRTMLEMTAELPA